MGLHVGVFGPVEGAGPLDGKRLDLIDHLAPAVVARTGIALGVLVREDGTHRLQHRQGCEVLRGDQLDVVLLARQFLLDQGRQDRISLLQ